MSDLNQDMTDAAIISKAKEILSRRFLRSAPMPSISDVADYFILQLAKREQEIFCVAFFDSKLRLIDCQQMFYGTINHVLVYTREIVKRALKHNAASVILAHNHPSGNIEISKEGRNLTHSLKEALALVDIDVVDHIVVGGARYCSFTEKGLL